MSANCACSYIAFAFCCGEVTAAGDSNPDRDPNSLVNGGDRAWQVTGSGTVTVTMQDAELIDFIGFSGVSMSPGSTITVSSGADVLHTFTIDDCSDCCGEGFSLFQCIDPIGASSFTLDFNDAQGGLISVCSFIASYKMDVEILDGWSIKVVDPLGSPRRSMAGTRKTSCGPKHRELSFRLNHLCPEDKQTLLKIERCKGTAAQMMVVINPEDECDQTVFLSAPKSLSAFTAQARFGRFSKPIILEEITCC